MQAAWLLWRRPIRSAAAAAESQVALRDWEGGREMPAADAGPGPREEGPGATGAGHAGEGAE